MAQKPPKRSKHANPALMRAIYWAIIIGIVAIFAIVTLEAIIGIVTEAFSYLINTYPVSVSRQYG